MGVPAFFKWLAAKYPLILESLVEDGVFRREAVMERREDGGGTRREAVEIHNLYLDTNGIVHPCCHPEDGPQPRDEDEMFANVARLIDRLVAAVRPTKLLFIALDGTAPRAKMNQQRVRRFCSAREAAEMAEAKRELNARMGQARHRAGNVEDSELTRWDHNVITPGTAFMENLAAFLRTYAASRVQHGGPMWQNLQVVVSDSSVPGEGEHKIVEYIRAWRGSPSYDSRVRHAICGQDADLIMLGLSLHEPNVMVLREHVPVGPKKKDRARGRPAPDANALLQPAYQLLRIDTLRQYLLREFALLGTGCLPFAFNLEALIDDFVFLCFFVGNDFLPHLPSLDIREGGLDMLLLLYKHLLPHLGGYVCQEGRVDLGRVEALVRRLALVEGDILYRRTRFEDAQAQRARASTAAATADLDALGATSPVPGDADAENERGAADGAGDDARLTLEHLEEQMASEVLAHNEALAQASGDRAIRLGEKGWHERYYKSKLGTADSPSTRAEMVQEYVKGLCWVAEYYTQGVPSWQWFFPFHYAPFACDLKMLNAQPPLQWDLGAPFSPLTQLMSVLPAASSHCLPQAFASLMTDPDSPVADFYPADFDLDPNGKPAALRWLWVAKLPFIEVTRLTDALAPLETTLTPAERRRNDLGTADLLVNSRHPTARALCLTPPAPADGADAAAAAEAEDQGADHWTTLAPGLGLGGFYRAQPAAAHEDAAVATDAGAGAMCVNFRQPPKCWHSSALSADFWYAPEPIPWETLERSLPRRSPRLPLNDNALQALLTGQRTRGGSGGGRSGGRAGRGLGGRTGRNATTATGAEGGRPRPCKFFNSPGGCHNGNSCRFAHK